MAATLTVLKACCWLNADEASPPPTPTPVPVPTPTPSPTSLPLAALLGPPGAAAPPDTRLYGAALDALVYPVNMCPVAPVL